MATGEEILSFLKKHKQEFAQRFSVRRIGLFGSYRRGTPGEQSDADGHTVCNNKAYADSSAGVLCRDFAAQRCY